MKRFLNFISIIGLLLILTLGVFTLPWADDFCSAYYSKTISNLEFALKAYNEWDGRLITYFMLSFLLKNVFLWKFSIFLWISCFLMSVKAVQKFVFKKEYHGELFPFFLLASIFWIGMRKYISETVYWSSGGGYTFAAFIGLYWILTYESLQLNKIWKTISWALFSVIAGIGSYSLSPALITFMFYPKLVEAYQAKSIKPALQDKKFIISLIFVLVGTAILVSAPGNFIRSTHSKDAFTGFIPWTFLMTIFKFATFGWPLIILGCLLGFSFKDKMKEATLHDKIKWLLVALATASPFAMLNSFTAPRTSIFFHLFILIFILLSIKGIRLAFSPKINRAVMGATVLGFYSMILTDHFKAFSYYQEYSSQLLEMEHSRSSHSDLIFVKNHNEPRSLKINELSEDPQNWANQCTAKFFDVKSIALKKEQ